MAIGNELIERSNELGELLAREEGKPRAEGVGEVYRSGQFFHYFAAEVLRQIDDRAESVRPGIEIETKARAGGCGCHYQSLEFSHGDSCVEDSACTRFW